MLGTAQRSAELTVRWNDGTALAIPVSGSARDARVRLPGTPTRGRHTLTVEVRAPTAGAAVLDHVIVERGPPARDSEP